MSQESDNQNQPASPRQRQAARENGHVVRSPEVVFAAVFTVGASAMLILGPDIFHHLRYGMQTSLRRAALRPTDSWALVETASQLAADCITWLAPLLLMLLMASFAGHWIQHGPLWLPTKVLPNFSRISPAHGWSRLGVNLQPVRIVMGLIKLASFVGVALYWWDLNGSQLAGLMRGTIERTVTIGVSMSLQLVACYAGVLLLSGAMDFAYRYICYERSLMTSPEESREEVQQVRNDLNSRRRSSSPG